jgi:mono/diheme cytochrome c family protein
VSSRRIFAGALTGFALFALAATPDFHHGLLATAAAQTTGQRSSGVAVPPASPQRMLLDQYCVTCHNQRLQTAGLRLDGTGVEDIGAGAEVWEKVLRKIRAGAMPPPSMPRPDKTAFDAFASWLEATLDRGSAANPNPGRVAVHRLNQAEYANAVRDLVGLEVDGRSLVLPDAADEHGFDNIAGVLSLSPALLERYLSAARTISRLAVGDRTTAPAFTIYDVPRALVQDDRMSEDLPFGSRGGTAIHHRFLLDAEYVVKIRLRRQLYDYIIGLGRPHQLEVRLDGKLIKVFTVGGENKGRTAPASFVGQIPGDPDWEEYMHSADAGLEARFPVKAGSRVVAVSFIKDTAEPEGVPQPPGGRSVALNELYDGNPSVASVAIGGPYNIEGPGDTPSRRKIFSCVPADSPGERPCARTILSALARRAYRRPVTEEDIQTLLDFYDAGHRQSGFEAGIQSALERILASPDFLFRLEGAPANLAPGTVYRLGDVELASRLSFFLWSSIPDDQLLDLAARGTLKEPANLQQQVLRMLADPRSSALVDNFVSRWLNVFKLRGAAPDPDIFPDFDENLRQDFQRETVLFVQSQLRADRSVVDLLSANYTFVNERLARQYQIPNIYGERFRRVDFSDDRRGGLLGQGSILTVTSYGNRTSPVLRGKWLLEMILGTPPPPPPPDVPPLKEKGESDHPMSVRERLEQHRQNPACASCHVRMDPLGFALENFDAIGKWRNTEDGVPIDASAALPDGTKFEGVTGLRTLLLSHREQFVGTFTEKLLTYALGREVEYYDLPAVRKITRGASDSRWSSIILGIVNSVPFQMSIARGPEDQQAQAGRSSK